MLFERAEELGRLIGQTNEAKALRRAEDALRSDVEILVALRKKVGQSSPREFLRELSVDARLLGVATR